MTGAHVKIGLLSLCLVLLLAVPGVWISRMTLHRVPGTNIAVEHEEPVAVKIIRLASSGTNVFEISHSGSGSIALHVPDAWQRQEVHGVPLATVTAEPQPWEYVRWTLPRHATVRFDAPNPGTITLHNPSGIPLTVTTVRIDVEEKTRQEDATIVTIDPLILP